MKQIMKRSIFIIFIGIMAVFVKPSSAQDMIPKIQSDILKEFSRIANFDKNGKLESIMVFLKGNKDTLNVKDFASEMKKIFNSKDVIVNVFVYHPGVHFHLEDQEITNITTKKRLRVFGGAYLSGPFIEYVVYPRHSETIYLFHDAKLSTGFTKSLARNEKEFYLLLPEELQKQRETIDTLVAMALSDIERGE